MTPPRPTPARPASLPRSAARRGGRRRLSLAAWLVAAGLAPIAASASAADAPRTPLIAPRPQVRVVISSPIRTVYEQAGPLEAFVEPVRGETAKPGVLAPPQTLRSPVGRPGPIATAPVDDEDDPFTEPTRLSTFGGTLVRRIEPAPAIERSDVDDEVTGDVGRVIVSGPAEGVVGTTWRAEDAESAAAADAALARVEDVVDGPAVPGDPQALEAPAELPPAKPLDPLSVACDEAIRVTAARLLTGESRLTRSNSPWQIGHGLMALREDYTLIADGRRVRALDWIASGPTFKNEPWFVRGRFGPKAHEYSGTMYDFEGHPNQILAFLAMSSLPETFELKDGDGRSFTIADWLETAKRETRLNPREEVTWTLWAFSVYLDSDAQWLNARREGWSMERLVEEELKSDPNKHACGGTHGLYALASARNARLQEGHRLRGRWLLAHEKVNRYVTFARSMQNPDGSFSDKYFQGRSHQRDLVARIGSSGHMLEFLMMALPQSELESAWVRAGVGRVATDLLAGRQAEVGGKAVGGMYHAVHALKLYRERTDENFTPVRLQTAEAPIRGRVIR